MTKTIFMHHLTREEVNAHAHNGGAIVVPLAATEQHGPHLPVYTDVLICEHIMTKAIRQAAEQVDILMTPVLPIGCSEHHLRYGGTLSFRSSTYLSMVRDIAESLLKDGFGKIIFVNAHGGNDPIMRQVANDIAVAHPVWTAAASYWNLSSAALAEANASEVGMVPGHAGGFETAAIMAIAPELVRHDQMTTTHVQREWIHKGPAGAFIGRHGELTGYDGYTDAPHLATAEAGNKYLDIIAEQVAQWLVSTVGEMNQVIPE